MATQRTSPVKRSAPRPQSPSQRRSGDLLGSLKIWQKLVLVALVLTLPLLITLGLLIAQQNREIGFSAKELQGLNVIEPLTKLTLDIPTAAGLSSAYAAGSTAVRPLLDEQLALLDSDVAAVANADAQSLTAFAVSDDVAALRTAWNNLKTQTLTLSVDENRAAWNDLIGAQLVPLILKVGNNSNLILDPDIDTYYAMDVVINKLPELAAELSDTQTLGQGALQAFSAAQRTELSQTINLAETVSAQVSRSLEFAAQTSPELVAPLQRQAEASSANLAALTAQARNQIISADTPAFDPVAFSQLGATTNESYSALNTSSVTVLAERLRNRIDRFQRNQLIGLTLIALVVALAFLLVASIVNRISRPINQLFNASKRLSEGDLSARADVNSSDELGVLAASFNDSVNQLQLKAQADAEILERNRELQGNIGSFLNVAMDIASGDFTQRGKVSEDVLGNVVDAINLMVEEIGLVLTEFSDTAGSVRSGSGEMLLVTEAIAAGTQQQTAEAQRARNQVVQVTGSIQQMARDAEASAEAAQRALVASEQGQKAVDDTLGGMQNIRREVQGISKRVKTLGERSLEISEIVETISRISSQTNLLALNAAIEAAGAGEAGQRFSVIADEVRKLAENTSQATDRVDGLIKRIQEEVQEVNIGVEGGTKEVEAGYRVATEAGERLQEVAVVVRQAVQFAESILHATETQVVNVAEVGSSVQSMATLSESSRDRVIKGREAAENLQELAERLTESLVRFRLA